MNKLNWSREELITLEEIPKLDLPTVALFERVGKVSLSNIESLIEKSTSGEAWGISTPYTTGGYGMEINTEIFERCMLFLELNGIKIFNFPVLDIAIKPLRIKWCLETGKSDCDPIFNIIYKKIFQEGDFKGIYRTPIWWSSDGCGKEDGMFKKFGIPVYRFPGFREILRELNLSELKQVKAVSL